MNYIKGYSFKCLICGEIVNKITKYMHEVKCREYQIKKQQKEKPKEKKVIHRTKSIDNNDFKCEICEIRLDKKEKEEHLLCHGITKKGKNINDIYRKNLDNNLHNIHDNTNNNRNNNIAIHTNTYIKKNNINNKNYSNINNINYNNRNNNIDTKRYSALNDLSPIANSINKFNNNYKPNGTNNGSNNGNPLSNFFEKYIGHEENNRRNRRSSIDYYIRTSNILNFSSENSSISQNSISDESHSSGSNSSSSSSSSSNDSGLKEDIIKNYPITKIKNPRKLSENKKKCLICLENFKKGDNSIVLPCIHIFHSECIKTWMKKKNSCPLCKNKIK